MKTWKPGQSFDYGKVWMVYETLRANDWNVYGSAKILKLSKTTVRNYLPIIETLTGKPAKVYKRKKAGE